MHIVHKTMLLHDFHITLAMFFAVSVSAIYIVVFSHSLFALSIDRNSGLIVYLFLFLGIVMS